MLVDGLQCGKICSLERKQLRFFDPHAARQPLQALPRLFAQRDEIEKGPQGLGNKSSLFAEDHAVDAG